jgi:hypothetical protein
LCYLALYYVVTDSQGSRVAVKMLGRGGTAKGAGSFTAAMDAATVALRDEAAVMCQLYHPHVARIYGIVLEHDNRNQIDRPKVLQD